MIGKLLAAPFRIVNAPFRAVEVLVDLATDGVADKGDRVLSAPLEIVAKTVEKTTTAIGDDLRGRDI